VRKALGRQSRDMKLLWGQHLPRVLGSSATDFSRSTQFLSRAVAPGEGAECIEDIARLAQRSSRIDGSALTAQPSAISQEKTPSEKCPIPCNRPETLQEELLGFRRCREQRFAVVQHRLNPWHRRWSRDTLHLFDYSTGRFGISGERGSFDEIRETEEL